MNAFIPTFLDASVVSHSGTPLPDTLLSVSLPPRSIGTLLTAHSTQRLDYAPRTTVSRISFAGIAGSVAGACVLLFLPFEFAILCFVAIAVPVFFLRRRRFVSTYVGVDGIARFTRLEGQPENDVTEEVLSFDDAVELRWNIADVEINAGYGGSSFEFCWLDSGTHELFCIRGAFHSESLDVPDDNTFHFAMSAKAAWNEVQAGRTLEEMQQDGVARFRVFDSDSISIGSGFLDGTFSGNTTRLIPRDVDFVTIDDGALHIETKEKKWYRKGRISRIACGRISNFDQLLQMLEEKSGFPIRHDDSESQVDL